MYSDRLKEEKKNGMEKRLIEQGLVLKGVYGSAVGSKTEEELKKQINDHLKITELLGEKTWHGVLTFDEGFELFTPAGMSLFL